MAAACSALGCGNRDDARTNAPPPAPPSAREVAEQLAHSPEFVRAVAEQLARMDAGSGPMTAPPAAWAQASANDAGATEEASDAGSATSVAASASSPPRVRRTTAATEPPVDPGATGWLGVVATPWASISIDGHTAGTTPLAPRTVAAGQHAITAVNPQLDAHQTRRVTVHPGERLIVRFNFTQPQ